MMDQATVCPTCNGSYLTIQKDGALYTHGCPPLSEWEKKAIALPLADTVERPTKMGNLVKAAITASGV